VVGDLGLLGKEDEEGTDGDLGTDVEELSEGTGDGSGLLPEALVGLGVDTVGLGEGLDLGLESLF